MIRHSDSLLERLPLVTYMLRADAPSPVVYVSPQIEEVFGIPPDVFAEDEAFWTNQIVADDRPRFLDALQTLRGGATRMEVEYRVRGSDGRPIWVRDIAAADDDGHISGYLVDITREKQLEDELAVERATLDAFFTQSSIGLAITDAEGRYVRMNGALARLNGGSPGDFIARTLAEVAPHVAKVVDPLRERAHEGGEHNVDVEHPNGTVHTLLSYFPFVVGDQQYLGRVVVDMTERHKAEVAAQRYRHLIEQLPLASYVNEIAPGRRAVFVSPQIEDLTGYATEIFLTDPDLGDRLIHPEDLVELEEREALSRERGEPFEHEYRIVRADGEIRWVLDLMETVYDDDGAALYEQGFLVDVTDRHDAVALLRAVWDGALDAIVITDDDGAYIDANPAACELFGRTHDEISNLHVTDVCDTSATSWSDLQNRGQGGFESVVFRPDGERRDVEGAARANVMPGRHVAVFRDVTERKQMEAEIWRVQKLESVARLAGGVAHDFNNLLTAIRGYSQLLQARVASGSVEQSHAAEIDRVVDRAAVLTAQLLALGRRQTLRARPLDLNRQLEEHTDSLIDLAGAQTELTLELAPALRAVRVDGPLLMQAIANIVGNASEAMPEGGRILVRTRNEEVRGRDDLADGCYVVLCIEDTGPGLDEPTLEHVFEPFFTTKDAGAAGRGLGLASAYGTVKQSGGTITVESHVGVGTTFSIFLPEATAGDGSPAPPGNGEAVLVVERDPAVRDVVFELLADASYRVLTARTTAEAVRLAERYDGPIDLILTDLDELRQQALLSLLRVERPAVRALALPKPYTPERLQRAVREALESPIQGIPGHRSE